MFDVKWN